MRQRKLPLPALVALMGMRKSVQSELDEFFAHLNKHAQLASKVSEQAFAQARLEMDRRRCLHGAFWFACQPRQARRAGRPNTLWPVPAWPALTVGFLKNHQVEVDDPTVMAQGRRAP